MPDKALVLEARRHAAGKIVHMLASSGAENFGGVTMECGPSDRPAWTVMGQIASPGCGETIGEMKLADLTIGAAMRAIWQMADLMTVHMIVNHPLPLAGDLMDDL